MTRIMNMYDRIPSCGVERSAILLRIKIVFMDVVISPSMTVDEVCAQFHRVYPYLKLKFFYRSPMAEPFEPHKEVPGHEVLENYLAKGYNGKFQLEAAHSTAEAERKFVMHYHLHVQVLRRSRNTWLITTTTDYYSLAEQNLIGMEMASRVAPPEPTDIHEQD
jgi:hypothetical protein